MIGGAPPTMTIYIVKQNVIGHLNRLKSAAKAVEGDWREFHAGAMCMMTHKLNTQLTRFGVVVKDD